MMFKRWMTSYIFTRYARQQYSMELDTEVKGRYRSNTAGTGAL